MKSIPSIKFSCSLGSTWNVGDTDFPSMIIGILNSPMDVIFPPLADVKFLFDVLMLLIWTFCDRNFCNISKLIHVIQLPVSYNSLYVCSLILAIAMGLVILVFDLTDIRFLKIS